jgi:hypothetical protein
MRIFLTAVLATSAVLRCTGGPIDFSPTSSQRELEGVVFHQLLFHQDGHAISYEQPRGWTYTGGGSQLKLRATTPSQVEASIDQVALAAPQVFDEPTTNQLKQFVLASTPGDAQKVQLVAEEQNPLRIKQQDTYAVTVGYNYFGEDYKLSVLFANLGDLQLRFRLTARKADFDGMQRAFRGSLFSLHWQ